MGNMKFFSRNKIFLQVRREICNLAFGDLPAILSAKSFVVNKFETELDPTVVDCIHELVYRDQGSMI